MRRLDALQRHLETDLLAGQFAHLIIGRESQIESAALTRLQAGDAVLEIRQHASFAQHDRVIGGLAALEHLAVEFPGEVDDDAIAAGGGALDPGESRALLAQHLDGLVQFGFAHFNRRTLDGLVADAVQLHFRVNFEHGGKLQPGGIFQIGRAHV